MTRHTLAALCFLIVTGGLTAAEPLRVMSFNIRYGSAKDGVNHWDQRKELVADVVRQFSPDLMGVQESLEFQASFLLSQLDGYQYFGRSRMNTPNEHCGIFFKADRFVRLAGGHFWLSEKPEIPESKSWDSSLPRMATWLLLCDRENDDRSVLFLNTHFDHRGKKARLASAQLLRERVRRLKSLAQDPVMIVTGDFNTAEGTAPYLSLVDDKLHDTYRSMYPERRQDEGTFNGWNGKTGGGRIDWILYGGPVRPVAANILRTSKDGRYPSDHFPVTAIIEVE